MEIKIMHVDVVCGEVGEGLEKGEEKEFACGILVREEGRGKRGRGKRGRRCG